MGTISSNNFDTRAGSGSLSFTEAALTTTSGEVESISSIKADYDKEDSDNNASFVFMDLGEFTFTMFDKLDNGNSLFSEIDGVTSTNRIELSFSFTTNGGRTFTDTFYFYPRDIDYNADARTITIKAAQQATFTDTVQDIFDNNPSDVYDLDYRNGVVDSMPMKLFLQNAVDLFDNTLTTVVDTSVFNTDAQTESTNTYLFVNDSAFSFRASNLIKDELLRIAAAEGAVVGSFMGYNFYVNRLSTSQQVTLTSDDIDEQTLKIDVGLNSYITVRILFEIGAPSAFYSFANLTGDDDGLNDDGIKRLDAYFVNNFIEIGEWSDFLGEYEGITLNSNISPSVITTEDAPEGVTEISVDDGSGGAANTTELNAGDMFYLNGFSPFYVAAQANDGTTLYLETPTISQVPENSGVTIIADNQANSIAEAGVDAYAAAYGATGANMIELTVYDIDAIKPYESFTFDSSVPELSGKSYRPSMLEYDFVRDKIKVRAYEIG